MKRLVFHIKSTEIDNECGIVDIFLNGSPIARNMQLTTNEQIVEHEFDSVGFHIFDVNLLNDKAIDTNNDGKYDKFIMSVITKMIIVDEDVTTTIIPKFFKNEVEISGKKLSLAFYGNSTTSFDSYGLGFSMEFIV